MRCHRILAQLLLSLLVASACSQAEPSVEPRPEASQPGLPAPQEEGPLVLFLGDSLAAGLHLHEDQAFPSVLQRMAREAGHPFRLINAGISGDTTAGGLGRIDWSLKAEPDIVVLELGGNDGLRGIELSSIEQNLRRMIEAARASGARVLLLGMRMPPNYGPAYTEGFEALYARLAEETGVSFLPFFIEGVGGVPEMNLPDGIHPTIEGHRRIADNIAPALWPLLGEE